MTPVLHHKPVHVVLVPGFWLGGWAWDEVVPALEQAGLVPHPVTLPGMGSPSEIRRDITLADHVEAVRSLVEDLDGKVVLVGHSGGAEVVSAVVDAVPERISAAVYVDAFPLPAGMAVLSDLPPDQIDVPLPTWEQLESDYQASLEGIDEEGLQRFRERAVPTPARVASTPSQVSNESRRRVPVTVISTSAPAAVLQSAAQGGEAWAAELAALKVQYVDMPTGHWPMFSRPVDLAEAIKLAAR
ncbi:pimeloyl-ACP methyl ester carboxylesterase [Georgenia soli]|uniref:Pimeloyl-ACP methyl ester carboxylesterase n=1 Tax=Georgenia soli TaxID=638953 RepID=A0A2A9EL06_9MICO|nr:alpha/beta hydrolase [Georgenia soli]PFG39588.1 pimeloyl-ACP methyl ester carboxylesterase [Georgenia soli]